MTRIVKIETTSPNGVVIRIIMEAESSEKIKECLYFTESLSNDAILNEAKMALKMLQNQVEFK